MKMFGVSFKLNASKKTLTAKMTSKFEFIAMFASLVVIDIAGKSKGFLAHTTFVRSLSTVNYLVLNLPCFGSMTFTTHCTCKVYLRCGAFCVAEEMTCEKTFLYKVYTCRVYQSYTSSP